MSPAGVSLSVAPCPCRWQCHHPRRVTWSPWHLRGSPGSSGSRSRLSRIPGIGAGSRSPHGDRGGVPGNLGWDFQGIWDGISGEFGMESREFGVGVPGRSGWDSQGDRGGVCREFGMGFPGKIWDGVFREVGMGSQGDRDGVFRQFGMGISGRFAQGPREIGMGFSGSLGGVFKEVGMGFSGNSG